MFPHKQQYKELEEDPNHDLTYVLVLESNVAADWKKWRGGKERRRMRKKEGGEEKREGEERGEGRKGRR